jgi:hypothetical protein
MSTHYDRNADPSTAQNDLDEPQESGIDDDAAEGAAAALRDADIESAKEEFDASTVRSSDLERMSIDELRELARQLDVPDRSTIAEQDELIAAIRRRL